MLILVNVRKKIRIMTMRLMIRKIEPPYNPLPDKVDKLKAE